MKGQETDPSSGVRGLLARGQEDRRTAVSTAAGPTAVDLLSRPLHPDGVVNLGRIARQVGVPRPVPELHDTSPTVIVPPGDVDIVLDPQWLADLDDPTLVISPSYVGPDRRGDARGASESPSGGQPGSRLVRRGVQVVLMTALAVVSLVMIASHSAPVAPHAPTPAAAAPGTPGTVGQRSAHPSRSPARRSARSVARHRSVPEIGRVVDGAASAASSSAGAIRSERVADAATVAAIRTSAREQSRVVRSIWRTVAAQRRAAAVIDRVERNGARRGTARKDRSTTSSRAVVVGLDSAAEDALGAVIGLLG
jgi:hypothetical protein